MSNDGITILPDGSAFSVMVFPLPKDHWLTKEGANVPPMPMRMGAGETRNKYAEMIRAAARYAIRASTLNGQETDFDPDAMVQNMVVGLLGYWTEDGLSYYDGKEEAWANPQPHPPLYGTTNGASLADGDV